ncbi:acyltransferase [[Brevibacterium] flavum]|uniref:Apolipoprotein N-acyltransferase n=1 Tax=[Brevibacterium] flavum TaxID=92706 RepID=A0A0F6WQI0_9CORY|nr:MULTISPECIES: apolipoprotein N-acyltransferase [Corynebacterium]AJE67419.1 acyltransferase [Corynebacterium glutamicum]AKF27457.1 acyltransferase [[Brevibacterium] flavum]AST20707.1 apolipoprotein N-acyltransferase [Corynebacterium glutamicum ATCC 14067]KEI23201.1 acyltransferase [Corynebacterium glutamicum ATCC 14067]KIH73726.1 acyltransferase [Corynebacterium glutamicum]
MTLFVRLALAAVSGLFVFASNEPIGWFVAGIVGTALFFISLAPWDLGVPQKRRKKNEPVPFLQQMSTSPTVVQGMLLGFVHGLVTYLLLLPWIGEFVGSLPYVALSVVEALYSIALGAFGVLIARWRDWKVLLFPAMYVAVEYLRSSWPFDGFAWVRLAWGQINGPLANLAALGGVAFVTFSTVLAAVGVAMVIISKKRLAGAIITASVIAIGAVSSLYVDRNGTSDESIEVAAIQGNVPRMGLDFNAQRRAVLANHARETLKLDEQVDLVIWPENSSDVNPFSDAQARAIIDGAVEHVQAPILVGTITVDEVGPRNTMQVFDPVEGAAEYHNKKFLQPFGEYMPFREFLRIFSPYVDSAGNFQPGDGTGVVEMNAANLGRAVTVGVMTCYEVIFDRAGRDAIANGAEFLTTPTNNATFGFTDMTYQQLAMSRMRAIEFDRAVVVAATSGVSAIVNPDGSISQNTRIFEAATLTESIPLKDTVTIAARVGFYVELLLVIIGVLAGLFAIRMNSRSKSAKGSARPAQVRVKKVPAKKAAANRRKAK